MNTLVHTVVYESITINKVTLQTIINQLQNFKSKEEDAQDRNLHFELVLIQNNPLFEDDSY